MDEEVQMYRQMQGDQPMAKPLEAQMWEVLKASFSRKKQRELKEELTTAKKDLHQSQKQNSDWKQQYDDLHRESQQLRSENDYLRKQVRLLRKRGR